jgi:hypothetical protein
MDNSFQKVFTSRLANARTPPAMGRRVDPFAGMPKGDVSLEFSLTRSQATHIALGFLVPVLIQFGSVAYVRKYHKKFLASLDAQSRTDLGVRIASSVWGAVCGVWASTLIPEALRLGNDGFATHVRVAADRVSGGTQVLGGGIFRVGYRRERDVL